MGLILDSSILMAEERRGNDVRHALSNLAALEFRPLLGVVSGSLISTPDPTTNSTIADNFPQLRHNRDKGKPARS